MQFSEYAACDAVELNRLVHTRQVSPVEILGAAIERIEALNPMLNAVVIKDYERACGAANALGRSLPLPGPLAGLPLLLKDLNAPAIGLRLTQGSRFRRDYLPNYDSSVVSRLKVAGAVVTGRTNAPEYGAASVTEPVLWGPARNPWNTAFSPGGSSGGAAVAVATGMVPLAHGNDAGGSNRTPAGFCGVLGLKPSRGRTPYGPELGELWRGMVVDGVLSRTVRDAAVFLDVTAGADVGAPHYAPPPERPYIEELGRPTGCLRIGVTTTSPLGLPVDPAVAGVVTSAARAAEALGHHVEEASPEFDALGFFSDFLLFAGVAAAFTLRLDAWRVGRAPRRADHELGTRLAAKLGHATSVDEYEMANFRLRREARRIASFFERYDIWLTPVSAHTAPRIDANRSHGWATARLELTAALKLKQHGKRAEYLRSLAIARFRNGGFLQPANVTGHPAISLPYGMANEMPCGIHFMGRYGDEAALFRLAAQFEQAHPWRNHFPPL